MHQDQLQGSNRRQIPHPDPERDDTRPQEATSMIQPDRELDLSYLDVKPLPIVHRNNTWVATGGVFICDYCRHHSRHILGMGCCCNDRTLGSNHANKQCRFFEEGESFHCLECGNVRQYERDPEWYQGVYGDEIPRRCNDRHQKNINSCKTNIEDGDQG